MPDIDESQQNLTSILYAYQAGFTDFQASGISIYYAPAYQRSITAGQRYVISGEIPWSPVVSRTTGYATWNNTKAEQIAISYTVPANTLSTSRGYRITAAGGLRGNASAGITTIVRYGGRMVTSGQVSTTAGGALPGLAWMFECDLLGAGATNRQVGAAWLQIGGASTASGVLAAQTAAGSSSNAMLAIDSTQDQTLILTVALGAASVMASGSLHYAIIETL